MEPRRLSAILSIDVVDYTQMMQADSARTVEMLQAVFEEIVAPAVKAHHGRVIKLMGDGALLEFRAAAGALQAAVQIQATLAQSRFASSGTTSIALRAGVHAGDVTRVGNELFGDALNIASRLQSAARPCEIWTSRLVCDLAGSSGTYSVRGEGLHSFKGVEKPIEVLSIRDASESTQLTQPRSAPASRFNTSRQKTA